jgi:cytochrome c553
MKKIIILSVATAAMLTFSGCGSSNDKKEGAKSAVEATKEAAHKTVEAAKETASNAAEATKEAAAKTAEAAKETANKAVEATKEAASKATEAAKETASKAAEATKEAANKATEAVAGAANKAKEAVSGGNEKGKAAYAKCVSCHGADGKTKALGKSAIIAGQSAADLEKKMQEYKAGTRNVAGMGTLMKGQVASLSDEDIKAVAEYISSLK